MCHLPIGADLSDCGTINAVVCPVGYDRVDFDCPCVHLSDIILDLGEISLFAERCFYVVSVIANIRILEHSMHFVESRVGYEETQSDKSDSGCSRK